jgi:Ca-activated chloride channel homolog
MRSTSMKLRIALLLFALLVLAGSLTGPGMWAASAQTTPPSAKPAAPPNAQTQAPSTPPARQDKLRLRRTIPNPIPMTPSPPSRRGSTKCAWCSPSPTGTAATSRTCKQNDFKVIDDQKPAELRSFHSETNLPLQVGLLVDASNSVRDRFKFEQEAAIEFLNAIIRPHYDKAFVVGFDATPEVTQDFTDNTENLSAGVRMLRAGGGTAMYDALYFACRDKLLKQEQTGPVRRAIILLSDGDDNSSHVSREEAIEMAQRADTIVYTISTNVSGMKGKGDKVLERIADATGGRAFFPFQMRDVSDAFVSIQEELRSQYAVAYKPANFVADGRYRTIEILAQDKGLKVRTRKGYYAPKQ